MKDAEKLKASWIASTKGSKDNQLTAFIRRHGQAHMCREGFYRTKEAAQAAVLADSQAIPQDHDYIVLLRDACLPTGEVNTDALEKLGKYILSVDHKIASGS